MGMGSNIALEFSSASSRAADLSWRLKLPAASA